LQPLIAFWDQKPKLRYPWAKNNEDILKALCAGLIDHETIAALPFSRKRLRVLVSHLELVGVLEPRELFVEEFLAAVESIVSPLESVDSLLLRRWARHQIVPLAVRRLEHGQYVSPHFASALSRIRCFAKCADTLHTEGSSLATMDQFQLDGSAATKNQRNAFRPFIKWLNKEGRGKLRVGASEGRKRDHKLIFGLLDRLILLALLGAPGLSTVVRLYMLFALLFGQSARRIGEIHEAQISDEARAIRFGDVWVTLPDPMPALIVEQLAARRRHDGPNPWLFRHAYQVARPPSAESVQQVLRKAGVRLSELRPTIMVALLKAVEYPLLARIIGVGESKLSEWAKLLDSPSWDQYVEMRRRQDGQTPTHITLADQVFASFRGKHLGESSPVVERAYGESTRDDAGALTFVELSISMSDLNTTLFAGSV